MGQAIDRPGLLQRPFSCPATLFAALAVASAWLSVALPIFSQEAYYWTYAQHPDLSYFDHPPMVAWLIWLGTCAFGDGTLGIRIGTWACGLAATWLGVLLIRDLGIDRRGQTAFIALAMASPIVVMTHFLANPDAPLVAAWTLTMWALWRAREGDLRWWIVAGIGAGLAMLSKYSGAFLGVCGGIWLLLEGSVRRQLRGLGPWLALLLAALVFLPVIWWNLENDFESFRFQTTERFDKGQLGLHWFAQFVGGQIGVLHPVVALAIPVSAWFLLGRARRDPRALFLLSFGMPMLGYLLFQSLWIQVKINWAAPAYVAAQLWIVLWWREQDIDLRTKPVLRRAFASLLLVPLAMPLAPLVRIVPPGRGSSWTGWDEIAERAEAWKEQLDRQDEVESNVFFFAADYRDAAQLGRALRLLWASGDHHPWDATDPGEPTLAQNVLGQRALQFDHWTSPRSLVGQDAVLVLPRPEDRTGILRRAEAHFDRIELAERVRVERLGFHVFDADIYLCRTYHGPECKR